MKTIKKLKNNFKTVAGSALLVGATLTAGAAAVTAQDSGSSGDLGDYPAPFVTEDGEVDTTVVVGETADDGEPVSTADVVSAIEIAGSLGNAAFEETETSVSVEGTAGTWSAENGATLNRRNSDLFIYDNTADGQTRFDDSDLNVLETTTFQSADSNEVEVEHDLEVGTQDQQFAPEGDYDDPVLHVDNPSTSPDDSNDLLTASVEFEETIDFEEAGTGDDGDSLGDADEWVEDGDTIEMFGQEFTFSDESTNTELVLYGSSDRFEVATGESSTVTIDGEDHEIQVEYVSEAGSSTQEATVIVDGTTQSVEESDTISLNGGEVRVSDIYRTGPDGQGRVAFSQGSNEVIINHGTTGSPADIEVDGESVDGVQVAVDSENGGFSDANGMTFYFGAKDNDEDFVEAGQVYEAPLFGLEFHYGGLNPDTADADNADEVIELSAEEDGTADFSFTTRGGEEADVTLGEYDNSYTFGDADGTIAEYEGQAVSEDDFVVLNAYEEAEMYEVTDVSDSDLDATDNPGEVSVTLENIVTGDSVTIEDDNLDLSGGAPFTLNDESIGGNDFDVTFEGQVGGEDSVSFSRSGESSVQVFPSMYTQSGSAVAMADDEAEDVTSVSGDFASGSGIDAERTLELPSTTSSSTREVTLHLDSDEGDITGNVDGSGYSSDAEFYVDVQGADQVGNGNSATWIDLDASGDATDTHDQVEFRVGQTVYSLDLNTVWDGAADQTVSFDVGFADGQPADGSLDAWNAGDPDSESDYSGPATLVLQPENDEDQEEAYVLGADVTENSGASVDFASYSGRSVDSQLDDDNVDVGYDEYGAYYMDDNEDSDMESFTLHMPAGQATAGMAVTGADGSLSAEGGGGSGSTMTSTPTYEFADAALDTDSNVGQAKQNQNLILVGGPSVNSLVQELVDDGQTMAASEYTEGEGMIQMVDGWSSGNSALVVAGHSAEDTRAAGEFLANYRDHQSDLEGETQVTISTETGSVVQ